MRKLLLLLLIILVICIAFLVIIVRNNRSIKGAAEVIESPHPLALDILESLNPYLREVGEPKHAVAYLQVYVKYKVRPKYSVVGVPTKHLILYHTIEQIVYDHNVQSVRDFWKKTEINYSAFIPKSKAALLREVYLTPKSKDTRRMMREIDNYLIEQGKRLNDSDLKDIAEALLKYNRIYKLKRGMLKFAVSRLRRMIKSKPESVIEYDMMPIVMRLEPCAVVGEEKRLKEIRRTLRKLDYLPPRDLYRLVGRIERKTLLEELERERKRLEKEKSREERRRLEKKITALKTEIEKMREPPKEAITVMEGTQTEPEKPLLHVPEEEEEVPLLIPIEEEAAPEEESPIIIEEEEEEEAPKEEEEEEEAPKEEEELKETPPLEEEEETPLEETPPKAKTVLEELEEVEEATGSGIPRGEENIDQTR